MAGKLLAGLLALVGLGGSAAAASPVRHIDPRDIRFSMATLANETAPLEPFAGKPAPTDLIFHEDEWRQIEFLPVSRLDEVKRMLGEIKVFEKAHRKREGWDDIYSRRLAPMPVLSGGHALHSLEHLLGVKAAAAPILFHGAGKIVGRVTNGFSLPLGGRVSLYGVVDGSGIPILAANLNAPADDKVLMHAFLKLSAHRHLILVDWRAQLVLISETAEGKVSSFSP